MQNVYRMMINRLRKYHRMDSLWVLWSYYHNAHYEKNFSNEISPHPGYWSNKKQFLTISKALVALREIICHTRYVNKPNRKGLMQPDRFGSFWDSLTRINDGLFSLRDDLGEHENLSMEFFKLAHQQFKWQVINQDPFNYHNIHYFLYTDPDISRMIEIKFGLTPLEFYGIGWILLLEFRKSFALKYDLDIDLKDFKNLSNEKIHLFYDILAEDIDAVKSKIIPNVRHDEGFELYGIKELLCTPIMKISHLGEIFYVSPISDLLLRSVGESLFFRLFSIGEFRHFYGNRFQLLCLKNIEHCFSSENDEIKFGVDKDLVLHDGKNNGSNTDFFLYDESGLIFMDAKTKMIPEKIYINFNEGVMDAEVSLWVKDILMQSYQVIGRYLDGDFTHCIKPGYTDIFPIILTLNDLYLGLSFPGYGIYDKLDLVLKEELRQAGIPIEALDAYPYMFISLNDLPKFNALIKIYGISRIMNIRKDPRYKNYGVDGIIQEFFPELSFDDTIVTDSLITDDIMSFFKA